MSILNFSINSLPLHIELCSFKHVKGIKSEDLWMAYEDIYQQFLNRLKKLEDYESCDELHNKVLPLIKQIINIKI